MTAGTGVKSALNASVFSASAGAFLLASIAEYPLSFDSARKKPRGDNRDKTQLKNGCKILLHPKS